MIFQDNYIDSMDGITKRIISKAQKVKLLILDVDGVLTDGGIYVSENGQESKRFFAQDGHGIVLLKTIGVQVGIISGRNSDAVNHRGRELGMVKVIQNSRNKLKDFETNFLGEYSFEDTCFVGDDVVDSNLLSKVGLSITVPNANYINYANKPHWITPRKGGRGAVRDVCDLICIAKKSVK